MCEKRFQKALIEAEILDMQIIDAKISRHLGTGIPEEKRYQ